MNVLIGISIAVICFLLLIVTVLVAGLLFFWWNLPCADAGSEPPRQP